MGSRASLCLEAERREVGQCFSLPLPEQPRTLTSQVPQVPVPRPGGIYSAGTRWGSQQNGCFLIWEKERFLLGTVGKGAQRCLPLSAALTGEGASNPAGTAFPTLTTQTVRSAGGPKCQVLSEPRSQEDKASFLTVARRNSVMETVSEQLSSPREQEHKSQHEGASCSWRVMAVGYQEGRRYGGDPKASHSLPGFSG